MTNEELLFEFARELRNGGQHEVASNRAVELRTELLRRLGAAVSASPQPRCPKCVSTSLDARVTNDVSCGVYCRDCKRDVFVHRLEDYAQFFTTAPAQEPDEDEIVRLSLEDWRYGCFVGEWSEVEAQRLLNEGQAIAKKLHDAVSKLAKLRGLTFMTFSAQEQPVENSPERGICKDCGADRSGPSAEAHDEGCPQKGKP